MANDREGGGGFAIGFMVGTVVGLALGLLFAPKPGEETREMLIEKGKEVREKGAEIATKAKKAATEAARKAQSKLEDVVD